MANGKMQIPDRKITVGALVSAIVTVTVWGIQTTVDVAAPESGFRIPAEIAVAFNGIALFVVQYFTKN